MGAAGLPRVAPVLGPVGRSGFRLLSVVARYGPAVAAFIIVEMAL